MGVAKQKSFLFKCFCWALYALVLCLGLEATCRGFWAIHHKRAFFEGDDVLHWFYPSLEGALTQDISQEDEYFDILILAGSVLTPEYGRTAYQLAQKVSFLSKKRVRLSNVSWSSHTTRDSLIKYSLLEKKRFDLIVFYHGINDVRANNIEPELYEVNYGHYQYYEIANALLRHPELPWITAPFTLEYLKYNFLAEMHMKKYLTTSTPEESDIHYGHDIKSRESFKMNLEAMIAIAKRRNEQFLVLTYGYQYPENYSMEELFKGNLGYHEKVTRRPSYIEMWGDPPAVVKGIDVHNQVIREAKLKHPEIHFFDTKSFLDRNREYFVDICHFSPKGIKLFSDAVSVYINKMIIK